MLRERLKDALTSAMKTKDTATVATVRLILAALKDRDIAGRSKGNLAGVGDDEVLTLLQSMIRQRHESVEVYKTAQRLDLAQQEEHEIEIIGQFLPAQLDEAEIAAAIEAVIAEIGASTLKDMGRTMAALKERHAGRMDFARASAVVKELLG